MEPNKILTADILDIVFEGRNKEYGAYQLRKTYNKRITIAIVATIVFSLLVFIGSVIASKNKEDKDDEILVQDMQLEKVKQEEKTPEPPPPPPPPKQEPPKVELAKFTPPVIVKPEEIKPDEVMKEAEDLDDSKISNINRAGAKDDNTIIDDVDANTGTGQAPTKKEEEDYDRLYTTVENPASFPGGIKAWNRFLTSNLRADIPSENNAPPAVYTVVVSFIVDKEGNVSEVKAENDPGYGTAEEAVRVIRKGPKWTPAEQNGHKVAYRHRQPISFKVEEQ